MRIWCIKIGIVLVLHIILLCILLCSLKIDTQSIYITIKLHPEIPYSFRDIEK
jgi:hypothetical protein